MLDLENIIKENFSKPKQKTIYEFIKAVTCCFPVKTLKEFEAEYLLRAKLKYTSSSQRSIESAFRIMKQDFGENFNLRSVDNRRIESFLLNRFQKSKHGAAQIGRAH